MNDDSNSKNKGIGKVDSANSVSNVHKSEAISRVSKTENVDKVGSVKGVSSAPTQQMSLKDRENLLKMVREESQKMFKDSNISQEQKEAIELAVQQTIDAALIEEDD